MFDFLAGPFSAIIEDQFGKSSASSWLKPVVKVFDDLIVPITIIALIVGAIWLIWLGVKLARAEDEKGQKEAKKAIINVAIALVCVIVMMWVLVWFAANFNTIFGQKPIDDVSKTNKNLPSISKPSQSGSSSGTPQITTK
jgi:quinol-cytochrome oxidoreductase complex cytochrome b subunit